MTQEAQGGQHVPKQCLMSLQGFVFKQDKATFWLLSAFAGGTWRVEK